MRKFKKYPQNIITLLVFLFACFGFVFFTKMYSHNHTFKNNSKIQNSSSREFNVNIESSIFVGTRTNPISSQTMNGNCVALLNLSDGTVKIESLKFKKKKFNLKEIDDLLTVKSVELSPNYMSTGKIDFKSTKAYLSSGIEINIKTNKSPSNKKITLFFPLTGSFNKNTGMVNLSGEATIPPEKLPVPLPVKFSIKATKAE